MPTREQATLRSRNDSGSAQKAPFSRVQRHHQLDAREQTAVTNSTRESKLQPKSTLGCNFLGICVRPSNQTVINCNYVVKHQYASWPLFKTRKQLRGLQRLRLHGKLASIRSQAAGLAWSEGKSETSAMLIGLSCRLPFKGPTSLTPMR